MIWARDEKRGALRRNEGDENERRPYRGEGREEDLREDGWTGVKDDITEKALG